MATIFLLALAGVALLSATAAAHKPILADGHNSGFENAIQIPDPDISWAVYGFLEKPGARDYYYWDLKAPLNVFTEVLVPKNAVYAHFHPAYAIVGPGLPKPEGLPFDLPQGTGALVVDDKNNDSDIFYEPFTGITYFRGARKHTQLTVPGRYFAVVFDKAGSRGDYVLAVGEKEAFGIGDIPGVISAVWKIRSGAADHSAEVGQK